jgi:hypothetical protein
MISLKLLLTALLGAVLAAPGFAQEQADPAPPVMREVSPGIVEIGRIRLDQKARTIRFPGELNLDEGVLEYLLVTPQGSTHESLLVSDVRPSDVHFAMLLLGAKGAGADAPNAGDAPTGQIDAKYLKTAPKLRGDHIAITVTWKSGDAEKTTAIEDWIFNIETKKAMERGPWIYNGSMFSNAHFMAQVDGAFAALVTYPSALINNPRQGSDNDLIWTVNTKTIPPVKTPLEISIQLLSNDEPKNP